jgi:hypothetical protein
MFYISTYSYPKEIKHPRIYVALQYSKQYLYVSGNTAVTFDKAGTRYFACAAGSHCSQRQKVVITAAAPGASPAPKPKENSAAAMAGLAVKLALGLGVGGAVLAAF